MIAQAGGHRRWRGGWRLPQANHQDCPNSGIFYLLIALCLSCPSAGASVQPRSTFRECRECPLMVTLPAGKYRRSEKVVIDAANRPEADRFVQPSIDIVIEEQFAVAAYPVTRGEYGFFVRETNRQSEEGCYVWRGGIQWIEEKKANWRKPGFSQDDDHPVVCVSWEDAQAYVRWLNAKAQGMPRVAHSGTGPYRLLSWQEAEYAAGGGVPSAYYWGERPDRSAANFGAEGCSPCRGAKEGADRWLHTSPVGSFSPNRFGLFDMAGNVGQLTDTCRVPSSDSAFCYSRIVRGGSWLDKPEYLRTDAWLSTQTISRVADIGFRVARSLQMDGGLPISETSPLQSAARAAVGNKVTQARDVGEHFRDCADCPEMVVIPPGTFFRQKLAGRVDEKQEGVLVTISKPYAVGVYPVTRKEYGIFARATGRSGGPGCQVLERGVRWVPKDVVTWENPGFQQTDRHPVTCVSWDDAHAYVQWLNGSLDEAGSDTGGRVGPYRLPSRNEWEYAARGGAVSLSTPYYWGQKVTHDQANYGLDLCGNCGGEAQGRDRWLYTSPVGAFPPNVFGLFDAFGNVWQFTEDCWDDDSQSMSANGSPWSGGNCSYRIARGGSYNDSMPSLSITVANQVNAFPRSVRNNANGFRVVRSL